MTQLDRLALALADHEPVVLDPEGRPTAAVAAVLAEGEAGAELLLIERASREGDPWSGHIAFPGGRLEPGDAGPQAAAERETSEELALDLGEAELLGRLSDVGGAGRPLVISSFVYRLRRRPPLSPSAAEVAAAWWTRLDELTDPRRRTTHTFTWDGSGWEAPALDLFDGRRPLLWGLTYHLVTELLGLLGHALPQHRLR